MASPLHHRRDRELALPNKINPFLSDHCPSTSITKPPFSPATMEEKADDPNILDQLEETEDALSFCDLVIYSPTEWESLSKQQNQTLSTSSSSSPPSDSDRDMFEFFSEEWSNSISTTHPLPQNIVFCGKIVPSREPISHHTTSIQNPNTQKPKPKKRGFFFQWKNSKLFRRNRTNHSVSLQKHGHGHSKVEKGGEKCGFPVRKVSILVAAVKPRWQTVTFGLARLPERMELSDIKSRLKRRNPATVSTLSSPEKMKRGKGLWRLLRSLYCGGGHHYRRASAAV